MTTPLIGPRRKDRKRDLVDLFSLPSLPRPTAKACQSTFKFPQAPTNAFNGKTFFLSSPANAIDGNFKTFKST